MTGVEETKATEYLRPDSKLDFTNYSISPLPNQLLSLMNSLVKRLYSKPEDGAQSDVRMVSGRPKFKDKDFKRLTEFDTVFMLGPRWGTDYSGANREGFSKEGEINDETSLTNSYSTEATMDNLPGPGRTIDTYFYQPVGRAIEKFTLKIGIRLNICHPSPAQILRYFLETEVGLLAWYDPVKGLSFVMKLVSDKLPSHCPGVLSLFKQSQ